MIKGQVFVFLLFVAGKGLALSILALLVTTASWFEVTYVLCTKALVQ